MKNLLASHLKIHPSYRSVHRSLQPLFVSLWVGMLIAPLQSAAEAATDSATASTTGAAIELIERVDHLDSLCREPMIAVHPDDTLFVTGYGSQVSGTDWTVPPPLWLSKDSGKTWAAVDIGTSQDGAQGNSDVDLTVGPDGTVYLLAMGFNRATRAGTHIAMGVSHDDGSDWTWQRLSTSQFDDRPWIRVAPDGVAHAIWNDGNGVVHQLSRDSGRSWEAQARIHPIGGSSHLAIGPDGQIAVRISAISASANQFNAEADSIAVSTDNGWTWRKHPVPGKVEWDPTFTDPTKVPRWVEPLAWGPDGTLFHLWSEGKTMHLGWSADAGASWQSQAISEASGIAFFPYMVASEDGRLAATWFVQDGASLTAHLALITPGQGSASPQVAQAAPFTPLAWNEDVDNRVPTPAGEYIPVVFLADGDLAVVSPIQDVFNDRWGFTFWRFRVK